ncbi:WD40/YVTN/BNR-like repeat-containing protein [Micromonospora sp. NPDC000089]|uniref:WD40/YVTN/BNR-like repeat-containing protein n=1 Tax=unclassified Micromonospora TaxID=2617518 RepID=UPI00368A02C7
MPSLLAIGTAKGLFLATRQGGRDDWEVSGPHFPMTGVYAVAIDRRRGTPRLLAGTTSSHFGPSVATSDDLGAHWDEPAAAPVAFPADTGAALGRVWQLTPAGPGQPDVVWAGTEPSALFRSEDGGRSFDLVRSLWDHPHREQWGAGFGGQAVHTVLPHPTDPRRVTVAMSTGGVYRSADAGASWSPANTGIRAYFLPDEWPEFGQCVHKIARDAGNPDRLYAQNHHGVYRSDDDGRSWTSIAAGLPSDFGFPIVAHPSRPGTVFAFPLVADGERFPTEHRCRVFRSGDAGDKWEPLTVGLPEGPFYPAVLRDGMCAGDASDVYFGTRSGEVYASRDDGDSWSLVAAHLPDVLCVRAAEV